VETSLSTSPTRLDEPGESIAIVVLTHNRVHLLRQCVENVLSATSVATREIVIWNNGSTDGTRAYLDGLDDPRFIAVHHETNIGQNGYARGFGMTSSDYLVELDDDVVGAPDGWDAILLDAYKRLPTIGFLAADLQDDPHDLATHVRYRIRPHEYTTDEINGVKLLRGPTGGACAMTSRELYLRVGGFREHRKSVFWQEEPAYIEDIGVLGYEPAVLAGLLVHHTGGEYYGATSPEKTAFWDAYWKMRARRVAIKKVVFRLPFFRRLNARYGWFLAPS
jgi:glycosyltransferase involved in cell wall biosynthesis